MIAEMTEREVEYLQKLIELEAENKKLNLRLSNLLEVHECTKLNNKKLKDAINKEIKINGSLVPILNKVLKDVEG